MVFCQHLRCFPPLPTFGEVQRAKAIAHRWVVGWHFVGKWTPLLVSNDRFQSITYRLCRAMTISGIFMPFWPCSGLSGRFFFKRKKNIGHVSGCSRSFISIELMEGYLLATLCADISSHRLLWFKRPIWAYWTIILQFFSTLVPCSVSSHNEHHWIPSNLHQWNAWLEIEQRVCHICFMPFRLVKFAI